jgi:hypothetical protein
MSKQAKDNTATAADQASADYKNMVDLLAVYSEATNRLEELQTQANRDFMECIDEHKPEYAMLQEKLNQAEAALEKLGLKHPEWFGKKKSIKTPYGAVKFHKATKLVVPNEEATLLLIEREGEKDEEFMATYTRKVVSLDLEALAKLDDEELARFRIKRVTEEKFSVEAASVDMGKAIEVQAKKEAA